MGRYQNVGTRGVFVTDFFVTPEVSSQANFAPSQLHLVTLRKNSTASISQHKQYLEYV